MHAMRHQEITFGVSGQSFFYDPPELYRPSGTPTVQVWLSSDDDTSPAQTATTGSCSVDSVDTLLSTAAVRGDQTITVDTGTGIARGRVYLLTAANKTCERVEVLSVSDNTIQLRHPLVNDYDDEATFQGTRITVAVNSTWSATAANLTDVMSGSDVEVDADRYAGQAGYRLRWAYTVNSVDVVGYSFADLVRYQAKMLVTPNQVIAGSGSTTALELATRLYTQRYEQLVREPKFPTDSGGGGASGQSPRLPITRR